MINRHFVALVRRGVIAFVGKRQPEKRRKGQYPANVYRIPDYDSLCNLAYEQGKEERAERSQARNLKQNAVRQSTQKVDEHVCTLSNNALYTFSDSIFEMLCTLSNTEVEGKHLEVDRKSGNGIFPDSEMGITSQGNANANGNGAPDSPEHESPVTDSPEHESPVTDSPVTDSPAGMEAGQAGQAGQADIIPPPVAKSPPRRRQSFEHWQAALQRANVGERPRVVASAFQEYGIDIPGQLPVTLSECERLLQDGIGAHNGKG